VQVFVHDTVVDQTFGNERDREVEESGQD